MTDAEPRRIASGGLTHERKIAQWIGPGKLGVEIGAGGRPLPGFDPRPLQVDCFKAFGADVCDADFYGHACRLPFRDHALDYVAASHVLEHVANPIAAFVEWTRVLRPGGIIYCVVPNRRATWDRTRELTTVEHLLADFREGTTAHDPTHIDEFAAGVDWTLFAPDTAPDEIDDRRAALARGLREAVARGEEINIHFHTFEPATVRELVQRLTRWPREPAAAPDDSPRPERPPVTFDWELLDLVDGFPAATPNGILAVLRVNKGWRARAEADVLRLQANADPRAILREDAERFEDWAARTAGLGGVR